MRELFSRAAKYLAQKRRHKIWIKVVSCLACAVVFCTTYALILPAITAEKTTCGYEEHVHEEECYAPNGDLTCQLTEHTHTEACYTLTELSEEEVTEDAPQEYEVSEDAVQETAAKSLPQELSGVWAEDVLAVAESQLGYRESTSDYIVDENDEVKGYTCYGDWYGNPYGDWCAEFVSFCMRYANVVNMPYDSDCANWIAVLSGEEYGLYEKAEEYQPNPGDIIFFDWEQDGISDHVGIVEEFTASTETENGTVRTIEGDSEDAVSRVTYSVDNPAILGYGRLPEMETGYICGKISHTHNIHCYDFKGEQILCPAEEHSHTEDCSPQPETPAEEAAALEEAAVPVGLAGDAGGNSVTFKVMIDGEWKALGSCPYGSGEVNGSQRAYITSDMAEQFFGAYGYTAGTEPGSHFGYSYDDIYHIFYTSNGVVSNFCMDVRGGTIAENQAVQIYGANNTDAQTFRIWQAEEGYSYITPIADSSLHINVLGGGSGDGTPLALHSATDSSSRWKLVSYDNGTTAFYSKNAPDSACIDVNSGRQEDGVQLQIWENGSNRYWHLDKQYRISNNIVSSQNSDGTYNIGLTEESNGDIVCYYLPGETEAGITNAAEDKISKKNSFWSVTVRDDNHAVYTDEQLRSMVQYVENSGQATVTVQNGNGILWSCIGKNGEAVNVTQTESGNSTTFVLTDITQPIEIVATKDNPSFTVQYYANIPRLADSGGAATLAVIDTSGKNLPANGMTPSYKSLQLEETNQYTDQNRGSATQLYKVMTKTELTKMYTEGQFQYETSPDLYYFNKLKDNTDYSLEEIWVLKSGRSADSTNRDDWEIYPADAAFTNKADEANDKTILLNDGAVLRLVSGCSSGDYVNETTFYDYNISSGQNDDGRWRTGITGINDESNYGTSINGARTWRSYADVLAFGNANCGTGMSGYLFDGGTLNKYNHDKNENAYGCTFGLAQGLNSDGTIRYNDWLVAPNLFNDGDANGKQTYSGSSLTFNRVGDTYTLSAATLNNSNGQQDTIGDLQYFFNPSPTNETTYTHILTNNFWPMDQAAGKTDALWGEYGNTGKFQGFAESNDGSWGHLAVNFPPGDDGNAHNWFFGMNFSLSFSLTEDYLGPLEYYFFGDDDLWVFLDGQLVCDIGGVHSSVGEYVNLRDYLPEGSSGEHTLSFFYTERGASGSTCYMSFTLPSVSSATTARDTGSLQLSKKLNNTGDTDYSEVGYQFKVELLKEENGEPLTQTYSYMRSDNTYGTIRSGNTITLRQNESITIRGIPAGTYYRVTELTTEGYQTTANSVKGYIASGTIETGGTKPAAFVNTPYHELPGTGGSGTLWYTFGGIALMAGALMYDINRRRKRGI